MGFSPCSEHFSAALHEQRSWGDGAEFGIILGLATYVRDALNGAPPEQVAGRLATLRDRLSPEYHNGRLTLATPAIEEMISAVEMAAERQAAELFDAGVAEFIADAHALRGRSSEPPEHALDAIMRAGNMAREGAVAVWRAMSLALVSPAENDR